MRELHLFAGIGGGILGGMLLGHTPVCAVEIEPFCRKVLSARQRDGVLPSFPTFGDVKEFDGKHWRGKVDVVCGGFPCQPFSSAGKRLGTADPRHLWPEMARIVSEVRPRYVFAENVSIRAFEQPYDDLRAMGYRVPPALCLGAVDVGAPHRRNRWWLLAADTDGGRQPQLAERDLEPQAGEQTPQRDDAIGLRSDVADSSIARLPTPEQEDLRGAGRRQEGRATAKRGWWTSEPPVGRVAHGYADRLERCARLRALGNAQVPAVAALAFRTLMEKLRTT